MSEFSHSRQLSTRAYGSESGEKEEMIFNDLDRKEKESREFSILKGLGKSKATDRRLVFFNEPNDLVHDWIG